MLGLLARISLLAGVVAVAYAGYEWFVMGANFKIVAYIVCAFLIAAISTVLRILGWLLTGKDRGEALEARSRPISTLVGLIIFWGTTAYVYYLAPQGLAPYPF